MLVYATVRSTIAERENRCITISGARLPSASAANGILAHHAADGLAGAAGWTQLSGVFVDELRDYAT